MTGRTIKRHPKVYPEANTMNKSRHVTFRCTQEQYELIKSAAAFVKMNVSEFVVRYAELAALKARNRKQSHENL